MRPQHDGMLLVRAELCDRLAGIRAAADPRPTRRFAESVESLKRLAALYGLTPVVRLADALERSAARDGGACERSLYLARLEDAIGCERAEESACQALLASVSVRFSA